MKLFFAIVILAFSLSTQAYELECRNSEGQIMNGSIEQLRAVMKKNWDRPQIKVIGVITNILPEDHSGLQHQKFSIKVSNDISLSIVSNLEFGRMPIAIGKTITVCGEFKKVGQGMVHWTHFDPHGNHADGFSIIDGEIYGDKQMLNK